jgi:hypothetical protein
MAVSRNKETPCSIMAYGVKEFGAISTKNSDYSRSIPILKDHNYGLSLI